MALGAMNLISGGTTSKRPATLLAMQTAMSMGAALHGAVPLVRHIKAYAHKDAPDDVWLLAGDTLGRFGTPLTVPGQTGVTGVSVRFFPEQKIAQIHEMTCAAKGNGGKMVEAMLRAAPDWKFAVHVDLSEGFWRHMFRKYPGRFAGS